MKGANKIKRAIKEFISFVLVLALEVLALFWVVSFFFGICAHALELTDAQRAESDWHEEQEFVTEIDGIRFFGEAVT